MFAEKPEISDNLEWMLQSRQVGDETLVDTLVHDHYAQLYSFGQVLLNSPSSRQAQRLIEKVVVEAVETANQYRGEMRVKVWLLSKTIKTYLSWTAGPIKKKASRRGLGDAKALFPADMGNDSIWMAASGLGEDLSLVFLLKYHQELPEEEIALVLDIQEGEVVERLNLAVQKAGQFSQDIALLNLDENAIRRNLIDHWPIKVLFEQEEQRITRRILSTLRAKERSKHRAVIFGEFLLIVFAVVIVLSIGSVIRDFTPEPVPPDPVLQTQLVNQLVFVSPTPGPTPLPTPFPDQAVLYTANESETLAEIGERIFMNVEILVALNNIPADQPLIEGQKVMIGVRDNRVIIPDLSPSTQEPTSIASIIYNPLHLASSDEKIRQRLLGSRRNWDTLWANAFVIQYGPAGYIGEPVVKRQQIWISQPYFSYFLEGDVQGEVEYISIAMAGLINYINLQTGEELSNAESELVLFSQNLHQQLLPSEMRESFQGEIEVLGMDQIAERDVLLFDWYRSDEDQEGSGGLRIHQGRYWIDATMGVILRRQIFTGNDLSQLFEDTVISAIEYNINIPDRLFDSSQHFQTYFAQDHRGDPISLEDTLPTEIWSFQEERENLPHPSPPGEFDPAQGRLSFQWTSLSAFDPKLGAHVDLFADGYYLGNIEFVDSNQIVCARSPDGRMIAFTGWSEETRYGYVPLRWLSLDDLGSVHTFSAQIIPYDFAFAPDNRQLAVYGCPREEEQVCSIYIIDTKSGETRELTKVEQGSGLTWSPDSRSLAIQGSLLRRGKWRVLAYDTQTGNIIYDGPFDWEGFWVEPDSPIYDWGVDIPLRGGLEICAQPP